DRPEAADAVLLAATDPANPYGVTLNWPDQNVTPMMSAAEDATTTAPGANDGSEAEDAKAEDSAARTGTRGPTRSVGAQVIIVDGLLAAYLGRGRQLLVYLPDAEPDRSRVARALAKRLADIARTGEGRVGGLLIGNIDGAPATEHPLAPFLVEAGFVRSALGFQIIRERHRPIERRPGVARWPRDATTVSDA